MITEKLNTKRISGTLLMSVAAMAVNYLISLVLTGYITENIGADAYGFVTLAKTISNYAIIFTSCLNSYASRFITVSYHKNDMSKANSYYSSVFYANAALSVVVLLISGIAIVFLDKLLVVPESLLNEVRILLLLDILNYMLLATGSCFSAFAYISDRLDVMNAVKFAAYSIEALILIALFGCLEPSIVYVGVALLASSVILIAANILITRRLVPLLSLKRTFFKMSAVKDLVVSGIWNSINSIGNLLQSGLDLIVSNLMLSATAMGQISIVKTLSTVFATLYQLLAAPFHPQLLKSYSNGDKEGVIRTMKISIKLSGFFAAVIFAGFVGFGKMYYTLWTPSQDISLLYYLTLITFLGSIIEAVAFPLFYAYTLTLKNSVPCFVTIISGLLNVGGMFVLIRYFDFGAYAVVLTTTVLGFGTYFVFTPIYAGKCLGCSAREFYPTMMRVVAIGFLMALIALPLSELQLHVSWSVLFASAALFTIIALPVYFFLVFNKAERNSILLKFKIKKGGGSKCH